MNWRLSDGSRGDVREESDLCTNIPPRGITGLVGAPNEEKDAFLALKQKRAGRLTHFIWVAIHDRMTVILHPRDFDRGLDRDSDPSRPPIDLLRPFPADEMEAFEVSADVGNVKNNSPELLKSK